jgi:hypothetical protein
MYDSDDNGQRTRVGLFAALIVSCVAMTAFALVALVATRQSHELVAKGDQKKAQPRWAEPADP